jgi:putative redox protein
MEVTVQHLGHVQFRAVARGHELVCDQPLDNGGSDAGMTPPELLLSALATCAGFYAVQYLRARSLSSEDLTVKVVAEKELRPARLASFRIEVHAPGVDPEHEQGILRAVHHCLIHNTLLNAPVIETVVLTGQLVA